MESLPRENHRWLEVILSAIFEVPLGVCYGTFST